MKIGLALALAFALPAACGGSVSQGGTSAGAGGAGGGGGGGGAVCGGLMGATCAADEFCDYPNNDCGIADDTGVCVKRPLDCSGPMPMPVCACDGKIAQNECLANLSGSDIFPNGNCPAP